jgi:hypothetical protein
MKGLSTFHSDRMNIRFWLQRERKEVQAETSCFSFWD